MYIPKINQETDRHAMVEFMRRYSFATVITAENNFPVATHLPFVIQETEESLVLISHFARANTQWKSIVDQPVLVIFSEPHAYISPRHYDKEQSVPTWNYLSVHAYGKGHLIEEEQAAFAVLEETIGYYEAAYREQWDRLPDTYKNGMLQGIMAFSVEVTELQGKKKLSQNKKAAEQERIIQHLAESPLENERLIAAYMRKEAKG